MHNKEEEACNKKLKECIENKAHVCSEKGSKSPYNFQNCANPGQNVPGHYKSRSFLEDKLKLMFPKFHLIFGDQCTTFNDQVADEKTYLFISHQEQHIYEGSESETNPK